MKQITVVIPNYNGETYLPGCLKSLYEHTTLDVDIIVVDNGSYDKSIVLAKEKYPQVQYVLLEENYGFSKAVNVGIQMAKTPYVFLLNNDAEIKENCLESLLVTIRRSRKIFSVETKMLQYHEPDRIDSAGTFYNAFGWASARGKGEKASAYTKREYTFAACGGAALYRKEVFARIGLFDETYFAYLEDIDIGYRARLHGYVNVYEPKAKVLHVGSAASGSRYNAFKVQYSARNNIYLAYKNMPWLQLAINGPLLIAGFGIKAVFFCCKGFGASYYKGIKEGIDLCRKSKKLSYDHKNFFHYIKIQLELWANIFMKRR